MRPNNALPWLLVSLLVIALDQWTKWLVVQHVGLYQQVAVAPGWLDWTLAYNTGAAWSFLDRAAGWQRWLFSALALIVSAVLVRWLARTGRREWRIALPLALIVGGALGNLVDRLRAGRVTDFILVHHGSWFFPAFNLADSAISVGAVLLVLAELLAAKRD